MNRTLRKLALTTLLWGAIGGAWAQQVHTCNFTGQPGAQPSDCLGADNSALKSTEIQGMVFFQPFAISNSLSQRMAGSSDGAPFAVKYPNLYGSPRPARSREHRQSYGSPTATCAPLTA